MQCREKHLFTLYNSPAVYKYASMAKLIQSYDLIGDVIIIRIPSEVYSKREIVAETLHKLYPRVRTIAAVPLYAHTDELYRTREVQVIWGDENLETTHKESGCSFKVDLKHVFFSPRLSYERMRVARKVLPAERIINTFSGVGCFSILIAKLQPQTTIYSIDVNPYAYGYMKENVALNKVEGRVIPILGDASEELKKLEGVADRVIMPLPEHAHSFLPLAVRALKSGERGGGVIHYYDVSTGRKGDDLCNVPLERAREIIASAFGDSLSVELEEGRIVRSVGPRRYHVVLDLHVVGRRGP
jgi:tRNA (guanine37-N1)-methyltransferase